MAEDFDPYRKWLGIPPKDQPPNHYRLLAIELFESDLDVIQNAADQRMAHIRSLASGKHATLSQKILNDISAANVCLMSPERKAAYDKELHAKLDAEKKPVPMGTLAAVMPVVPIGQAVPAAMPAPKSSPELPAAKPSAAVPTRPVKVGGATNLWSKPDSTTPTLDAALVDTVNEESLPEWKEADKLKKKSPLPKLIAAGVVLVVLLTMFGPKVWNNVRPKSPVVNVEPAPVEPQPAPAVEENDVVDEGILKAPIPQGIQPAPEAAKAKFIDLADIVGGGNGFRGGQKKFGIDPRTGELTNTVGDEMRGPTNVFVRTKNPLIDGVFIPDGLATQNVGVQITSSGTKVKDLPQTDGVCWDTIKNGPSGKDHAVLTLVNYQSAGHSVLGLKANKGITFDLGAIAQLTPGRPVVTLTGLVGNAGAAQDLRVYLDGKLQFARTGVANFQGKILLSLPLGRARFLTLVSTAQGNSAHGAIFLADPRLLLDDAMPVFGEPPNSTGPAPSPVKGKP